VSTYTDHDGKAWVMGQWNSHLSQDLHADLVAAVGIARAYQAKCERLEAMLDELRAWRQDAMQAGWRA
jgi:hypothetical protein